MGFTLGLLEESCGRPCGSAGGEGSLMPAWQDWSTLCCCCCAAKLNHSAPCCSVRLLTEEKNISLSPVMARGLCLDNIHSALQVIILGLFLEGNRRDTAWLLLFSVMREKSLQCGPSARALSLPRLCEWLARSFWMISQKLMGIRVPPPKLCFLLTGEYLLIFSASCFAKLCSNSLIIIWSWLANMHRVSLEHMGTFLRLLVLKICYSVISHKDWDINWYFSLPLLLLHILCTTSDRGVGGQTKKEMKCSLAKNKKLIKINYSIQMWCTCKCAAWHEVLHVDELCHLTFLQFFSFFFHCFTVEPIKKMALSYFILKIQMLDLAKAFSSFSLEREVLCQSLEVLWERESK